MADRDPIRQSGVSSTDSRMTRMSLARCHFAGIRTRWSDSLSVGMARIFDGMDAHDSLPDIPYLRDDPE